MLTSLSIYPGPRIGVRVMPLFAQAKPWACTRRMALRVTRLSGSNPLTSSHFILKPTSESRLHRKLP